ncbi:hypothetical protein [Burkholderia ubonensis]|uniref:hypothetical protein n=1 Tax=Burkholderia ubonensis TaxID=101571 RepID=UPI0018E16A38|nr:hypothetical protein [Burkholderia ubonensis]
MKCVVILNEAEELKLQQLSINHRHRDCENAIRPFVIGRRYRHLVVIDGSSPTPSRASCFQSQHA